MPASIQYKCKAGCGDSQANDTCRLVLPEDQTELWPVFCPYDGSKIVWVEDTGLNAAKA